MQPDCTVYVLTSNCQSVKSYFFLWEAASMQQVEKSVELQAGRLIQPLMPMVYTTEVGKVL